MEDRLEAKSKLLSNAHAGEIVERTKARLEHVVTDPKRPAKAAAILKKGALIKKRKVAPSAGPSAWTKADFEELLEVAVLHEPRFLTQRFLGAERRIRGTKKVLGVGGHVGEAAQPQLEKIQHILRRTWAERRRRAAGHRAAVAAAASAAGRAANNQKAPSPPTGRSEGIYCCPDILSPHVSGGCYDMS